MDGEDGDLAILKKNASQIMIFLPHYMWAENGNNIPLNFVVIANSKILVVRNIFVKNFAVLIRINSVHEKIQLLFNYLTIEKKSEELSSF